MFSKDIWCLVDSGASVSALPTWAFAHTKFEDSSEHTIRGVGGHSSPTLGKGVVRFDLAEKTHEWKFYVMDIEDPILGSDFLKKHKCNIDYIEEVILFYCSCKKDDPIPFRIKPARYRPVKRSVVVSSNEEVPHTLGSNTDDGMISSTGPRKDCIKLRRTDCSPKRVL